MLIINPNPACVEDTPIEIDPVLQGVDPPAAHTKKGKSAMPVSPTQYIPLINSILGHWAQVNLALGGAPATDLKLKGAYTLANLATDRDALQLKVTDCQAKLNARQDAASARDFSKAALRGRMTEFRNAVLYQLQGTAYTRGLPTLPNPTAYEGRFLKTFDDMATKWTAINALSGVLNFTAPLTLLSGYTLATFTTDFTGLRANFAAVTAANDALNVTIATRDTTFTPIYAHLKEYLLAVKAKFPATNSLVMSLPTLSLAGNPTPKPVTEIIVQWDAVSHVAIINFTPSTSANIAAYDLRYSPSNPYSAADETAILTNTPAVHAFTTNHALAASGDTARFRIVTLNVTSNEKGAKPFKITRP